MTAKKLICIMIALLLVLASAVAFVACKNSDGDKQEEKSDSEDHGELYKSDTELGSGSVTVFVDVVAYGKKVTFTVRTDKKTLGEALLEHGLIEGSVEAYGLYVKKVNGVLADYDIDQTYWNFSKDGKMMPVGVDKAEIANGEHYEFTRTK